LRVYPTVDYEPFIKSQPVSTQLTFMR